MGKIDKLQKSKFLLNQAINEAFSSMPNDRDVIEARQLIRRAIDKLDNASRGVAKKKSESQDYHSQWWSNIQSGVSKNAYAVTTGESAARSLSVLNLMISEEQKKINDIETQAAATKTSAVDQLTNQELLSD